MCVNVILYVDFVARFRKPETKNTLIYNIIIKLMYIIKHIFVKMY